MSKYYKFSILLLLSFVAASCNIKNNQTSTSSQKLSTAQPNVVVLKDLFDMPGLDRKRQIRIYLPPHYAESNKRYPVLYMHDAQNLFDDATSYSGEWKVDEVLNSLSESDHLDLIVVGIDNGQDKRLNELNPWNSQQFGISEAKEYLDFIVKIVKPAIDQQYRTLSDRQNTAMMGSSMGGLITHYAVVKYPEVFSKAGIFSPSYMIANESIGFFDATPAAKDTRLYFYAGDSEGGSMVIDAQKVYSAELKNGHLSDGIVFSVVAGAGHNEAAWHNEFARAVVWLFKPTP